MNLVKYGLPIALAFVIGIITFTAIFNAPVEPVVVRLDSNTSVSQGLTAEQVALHASTKDCWTIINSKVYDITDYLPVHPGGPVINDACGKNSTEMFSTKGGKGRDHSNFAKSLLDKYFIGSLGAIVPEKQAEPAVDGPRTLAEAIAFMKDTGIIEMTINIDGKTYRINLVDGEFTVTELTAEEAAVTQANVTVKRLLTLDEVSKHNKASDCWLIIDKNVYDVTAYIPVHPGGVSAIRNNCGKESSTAFNTRGGTGSHSTFARNLLNNYYVADLSTVPANTTTNTTTNTSSNSTGTPQTFTVSITSSGGLSPSALSIHKGDTVNFVYTNPGDEIVVSFSPTPPSSMKLDHEFTSESYTFMTIQTYTFSAGGTQGTITVQ